MFCITEQGGVVLLAGQEKADEQPIFTSGRQMVKEVLSLPEFVQHKLLDKASDNNIYSYKLIRHTIPQCDLGLWQNRKSQEIHLWLGGGYWLVWWGEDQHIEPVADLTSAQAQPAGHLWLVYRDGNFCVVVVQIELQPTL